MLSTEKKAELAVQGQCVAQRRLSEADADVERRNWVKEVLIWFFKKPTENSNLKDWSRTTRINGLVRLNERRSKKNVENWT